MKKKKRPSLFYWGAAGVFFHFPPSQRKIALEGATSCQSQYQQVYYRQMRPVAVIRTGQSVTVVESDRWKGITNHGVWISESLVME